MRGSHSGSKLGDLPERCYGIGKEACFCQANTEHGAAPAMAICTMHIHRTPLFGLLLGPTSAMLQLARLEAYGALDAVCQDMISSTA